jgi:hypothetical protein
MTISEINMYVLSRLITGYENIPYISLGNEVFQEGDIYSGRICFLNLDNDLVRRYMREDLSALRDGDLWPEKSR